MSFLIKDGETVAVRRQLTFVCVDVTDLSTRETGEAGGQPQISINGAAFSDTGIGVLVAVGNGVYTADLTTAVCLTGSRIRGRYKSANTSETDSTEGAIVVGYDPFTLDLAGLYTVTISVVDEVDAALADVVVAVYNSDNDTILARGLTDSSGEFETYLDAGAYSVRMRKAGYTFTVPETLTVTADQTTEYTGDDISAASSLCCVNDTLTDLIGQPVVGAVLKVRPHTPSVVIGTTGGVDERVAVSDVDGYVELELKQGEEVEVYCQRCGLFWDVLTVPSTSSQTLTTWGD